MKIEDILNISAIEANCNVKTKSELLDRMIDLAITTGMIINRDEALKDILDREKLMSTGIGKGIALPHAKTNSVKDTVGSFAIVKDGIDFESVDDEPVRIVFLLLGKEANVGLHIRLLSKISRILNSESNRENLVKMNSAEEILEFFKKTEDDDS